MPYLDTNYQIAVGNNNAGGLALVTSLSDANGVYFQDVGGLQEQSRGIKVTRANGTVGREGRNWTNWSSPVLLAQYEYLKDTYEGLVTIKIAFHSETFANYNAILTLPDFNESDLISFSTAWNDPDFKGPGFILKWLFTKVEAL